MRKLDANLQELLDQQPELKNASGAMPGKYSIKINTTVKPAVHGPRRQPEALIPKIKEKLKEMGNEGHLAKINTTVKPAVHGPRRQPEALLPKIKEKLKEMGNEGHLAKVTQPIDWVNSMVMSTHRDKIRICLDPANLNKAVRREHYPIPTVEEILAKIPDAKYFTVLDTKSGHL